MSLRPGEAPSRPARVSIVPWVACLDNVHAGLAPYARSVVPLELAESGDQQIVVHGRVGTGTPGPEEPAELDSLAALPTVTSLIVDRPVRLRVPLPHIRELIVTWGVWESPDGETLRNLPNLERLCHGRSTERKFEWEPLLGMPLKALRFDAYAMGTIGPIGELRSLEQLRIDEQSFESIAPLAACTRLRWLSLGWFKGMHTLGALERLRHLELNEGTVSSLKPFRKCRDLRSLVIFGRRLKSLSGIEGMTALEDLFLYNVGVSDLAPLTALPRLRRVRLDMPAKVTDFAPLGRMPTLESLVVHPKGSRLAADIVLADLRSLRSLRELALLGIDDGNGWEFLLDQPLERIQLWGSIDPVAGDSLRARFPEAAIDVRSVGSRMRPDPFAVTRLADEEWSIFENVSDVLDVDDNFVAERRLRRRLRALDSDLLRRLSFDSDADHLSVVAVSEADIRRVAEELRGLAAGS